MITCTNVDTAMKEMRISVLLLGFLMNQKQAPLSVTDQTVIAAVNGYIKECYGERGYNTIEDLVE